MAADLDATPGAVAEAAERARAAGAALARMPEDALRRAIVAAFGALRSPSSALGREARALLPSSTGLSGPMVEWALGASLGRIHEGGLAALADTRPTSPSGVAPTPVDLAAVILSANVFTAAVEPIVCSLLARVPTVLKASSRDDVFARLVALAWRDAAPEAAEALAVVTFPGDAAGPLDALLGRARTVIVYGHDATLAAVRARLPDDVQFVGRGAGLGASFVGAGALRGVTEARDAAARAALDVAAYDQRGCLSPHVILVEEGSAVAPEDFAALLAEEGLRPLARSLPRGALSVRDGALQMQWRGIAASRGHLLEGDGYAVSLERDAALRLSPGYRNVTVVPVASAEAAAAQLTPFGAHLKALGIGGVADVEQALPLAPGVMPRRSALGAMQAPPLDDVADGKSRWEGLTEPAVVTRR